MTNLYKILRITEDDVGHAYELVKKFEGQIHEGYHNPALDPYILLFLEGGVHSLHKDNLELVFTV